MVVTHSSCLRPVHAALVKASNSLGAQFIYPRTCNPVRHQASASLVKRNNCARSAAATIATRVPHQCSSLARNRFAGIDVRTRSIQGDRGNDSEAAPGTSQEQTASAGVSQPSDSLLAQEASRGTGSEAAESEEEDEDDEDWGDLEASIAGNSQA